MEEVLRRTGGLSGALPSGLLSLAVRLRAFEPAALDRAIREDRSVVRVPAMRGSLYLLPTTFAADGLALSRPGMVRSTLRSAGVDEGTYASLADTVEGALAGNRMTGAEIRRALAANQNPEHLAGEVFTLLLRSLSHEGRILRVGVRGGVTSQMFEYARTEEWLGAPLRIPDETEALVRLLPLYLDAHGPSSVKDVAWWAGVRLKVARAALQRVAPREVRLEGSQETLYASEAAVEARDRHDEGTFVTLLPHWDAYLLAHVDRTRYIPSKWMDRVVDRGGNTTNVVLRDGETAGVWDYSRAALEYAPFASGVRHDAIQEAAGRLRPILGELPLVRHDYAPTLHGRGQNAFRAPLRIASSGGKDR